VKPVFRKLPIPQDTWITMIAISCDNQALAPYWKAIEDDLRMIIYRAGWDPRRVRRKLEEIHRVLRLL